MFVCIRPSLHSVRVGQLLRCAHKRTVNIMKVYMERKNIQVELIRFRKNSDIIAVGNFEVGIILSRPTCSLLSATSHHCSVQRAPGTPDVSAHDHFGTYSIRYIVTSGHFGTYLNRYIVTSGHAQFGT